MSTITPDTFQEAPAAELLAPAETGPASHALGLYAWVLVSMAILVTAALLGSVEDDQAVRADDARTHSVVVADNR